MIWFFERTGVRLQCEIRRAASGPGYELVWTSSDGRMHIETSDDASELIRRRRALEHWLKLDGWIDPAASHSTTQPATSARKTDIRLN